jgi:hypothetical protein
MAKCEKCGNDYKGSFEVVMDGESHTYDSFECALRRLRRAVHTAAAKSSATA